MKEVVGRPNWVELEVGDVVLAGDRYWYKDGQDYYPPAKCNLSCKAPEVRAGIGTSGSLVGKEYTDEVNHPKIFRRKPSKSSRQSNVFTDWWILGDDVVMEEGDEYLLTGFGESPTRKSPGVRMTSGDSDSFGVGDKVEKATAAGFTIWRKMK